MIQRQQLSLPMAGGVDTRTDPRVLQPPKFAALDNCVFDTPASLTKRNGFARLNTQQQTVALARSLGVRRDELVLWDGAGARRSYAEQGKSFLSPGPSVPRVVVQSGYAFDQLSSPLGGTGSAPVSICRAGNVYVVTPTFLAAGGNAGGLIAVDATARAVVGGLSLVGTNNGYTCYASGNSGLAISMRNFAANLVVNVFMAVGSALVTGPDIVIAADLGSNSAFDTDDNGSGSVYVAYQSSTALTIKYGVITADGTYTQLGTQATAAEALSIGIAVDRATGNVGIVWSMEGAINRVDARAFNAAGAALAAAATVSTGVTGGTTWRGATCAWESNALFGTLLNVVFNHVTASGRSSVYQSFLLSGGVGSSPSPFCNNAVIVSRAHQVTIGGVSLAPYIVIGTLSNLGQNNLYLMTAGIAGGYVMATLATAEYLPGYTLPHLSRGFVDAAGNMQIALVRSSTTTPSHIDSFQIWRDHPRNGQFVQVGRAMSAPGGIVRAYDGLRDFEQNFLCFPEFCSGASSATAGSLVASTTYHYLVVFEYQTATGEVIQSTAVEDVSVNTAVGQTSVDLSLRLGRLFENWVFGTVYFQVYRREQGGVVYHLVSSRDPNSAKRVLATWTPATINVDTVTYNDGLSEATLLASEILPLSKGLSDNVAPAFSSIMAAGNGRIYLSGFDDPDLIWYSKLRETGEWLQFTDANEIVVENGSGAITALATLQDSLIIFRESEVYIAGGDGLDNTGTTGTVTTPRLIANGVGCLEPLSVIAAGGAVFFKAPKGIFSLDGGGQLAFIGADVSRYNGEAITSVVAVPGTTQLRWTTAARTLVYDYELQRWTHWTIGALHSVIWQGRHALLVDAAGTVLVETPGTFLDNGAPYTIAVQTAQVRATGMQGQQRLYEVLVLGKFNATHQVKIGLNFDTEATDDAEYHVWDPTRVLGRPEAGYGAGSYGAGNFGGVNSTGELASQVYQFSVRPRRQKCQSFSLRLEDQALQGSGPAAASLTLSEMQFEVGIRGDTAKLGVQRKTA